MATILYWNVRNFTDRKITAYPGPQPPDFEWDEYAGAPARLNMIIDTLQARDPLTGRDVDLDFIVIVEVYARVGRAVEGQTIDDDSLAATGCFNLLREIRRFLGGHWSLVPPVVTGGDGREAGLREGVAVFYRSDRWYFLGPDQMAYLPAFATELPNRRIPRAYPFRGGLEERESCGRYLFRGAGGGFLTFPDREHRKPWLTAFGDVTDPRRLLRLLTIHTTPDGDFPYAKAATENLSRIREMTSDPPVVAFEADVILGDFNVENTDFANFAPGGAFHPLINTYGYTPLIVPPVGLPAPFFSYYHTIGRPVRGAFITEQIDFPPFEAPAGFYPGQAYTEASLDNVFVRHRPAAGVRGNMTILSRARTQPYRPEAPGVLTGVYDSPSGMRTELSGMYEELRRGRQLDYNGWFRDWVNYGLVYSVSDHFALLFDV